MKILTDYTYAYGTPEELKEGKIIFLPTSKTLGGLERYFPQKGVLFIPKYVGVYQDTKISGSDSEDEVKTVAFLKGLIDSLSKALRLTNNKYKNFINSDLIHIGYDASIPSEIVKSSFGESMPINFDGMSRVGFSRLKEMPNFIEKDASGYLLKAGKLRSELSKYKNEYEAIFSFKDVIDNMDNQMKTYGLTMHEAAFLFAFNLYLRDSKTLDTDTPYLLKNLFSNN